MAGRRPRSGGAGRSPASQVQIAVQARRADLQALPGAVGKRELQPCVVLRWAAEDPTLSDGDRRRLWQQWWQAANLLMPIGNAWAVADVGCDARGTQELADLSGCQRHDR